MHSGVATGRLCYHVESEEVSLLTQLNGRAVLLQHTQMHVTHPGVWLKGTPLLLVQWLQQTCIRKHALLAAPGYQAGPEVPITCIMIDI